MKRNLNLIRDLLLVIEAADTNAAARYDLSPYDADVQYHLRLLFEGGYVRGVGETKRGAVSVRLTWQGHELLELARCEVVWERAMRYVAERAGGVSVAVLHKLLEQWSVLAADSFDWGLHRRFPPPAPAPKVAATAQQQAVGGGNGNGTPGNGAAHPPRATGCVVYPYRKWNGLAETLPLYLL